LKTVKESLDGVKTDVKNFRTDHDLALQAAKRDIQELRDEVRRLKSDLEGLRKEPTNGTRQMRFAPETGAPAQATGRLELRNTWGGTLSMVVNNRVYRVPAGPDPVLTDPIPAGAFTYEVIGITPPNNVRTLAPGETYVIHVHPRS
jgi:hypothetical protein